MEEVRVITEAVGGASYDGFDLVIGSGFFAVSGVLVLAGLAAFWRGREAIMYVLAGAVLVGGLGLAATGALAIDTVELIDNRALFLALIFLQAGLLALTFWVSMLVDCATNESSRGNNKVAWVIIIVFTNLVGAFLYLLVRRPQRLAEAARPSN